MDVTFELPEPAYAEHTWVYESEHNPSSQPPLTLRMPGIDQPLSEDIPASLKVNGYSYIRSGARPSFPRIEFEGRDLSPLARWRQVWLPRLDRHISALTSFDPAVVQPGEWRATLDSLEKESGELMLGVHMTCVFGASGAASRFVDAFAETFGEGRRADGLAMLHGIENATSSRATSIWQLSRLDEPEESDELRAFLECWGLTTDGMLQDLPTWREDPTPVLTAAGQQAQLGDELSPQAKQAAARARRAQLEAELRARSVAGDAAAVRALELLPAAQEHVAVSEDHNVLCDQRLFAASRLRWMAIGRHLQEREQLPEPDDVFFHTYDELIAVLDRSQRLPEGEILRRRAQQAAWRASTPPRWLGRPHEKTEAVPSATVRGRGASAGTHRGRALVARTIEEAGALEPGDVLVCVVSSPAWTPLFSIAGAIVTDSGGILSHPAVVAREFGIPAVVGCGDATSRISSGDIVEVDGAQGSVSIIA